MAEGDKSADLYRRYAPAIYARCRRLLGNAAQAEDLCQETFIRVLKHLSRSPNDDEVLRWIYRIATNLCFNFLRDNKRHLQADALLAVEDCVRPMDLLHDKDRTRALFLSLPEKLREPAWLYYVDGLEQRDVCEVLDISRRTLGYRLAEFTTVAKAFYEKEIGVLAHPARLSG